MPWGEAWRLTGVLLADPSSHIAASVAKWAHPVTREWMVTASLYDTFVAVNADPKKHKPTPHPRPWDKKPRALGQGTSMSVQEYRDLRAQLEASEA